MAVTHTVSLVTLRTQQVACLEALVQVGRDLRDAVVAGNLGAILDSASEHEHLVARLDQVEREIKRLPARPDDTESTELSLMRDRGHTLVQELSGLLAENRLQFKRAQERAAFRLYLLTGNDHARSMVDRRA